MPLAFLYGNLSSAADRVDGRWSDVGKDAMI